MFKDEKKRVTLKAIYIYCWKLWTFFIKATNIYFGHKDKVYVINKQSIIDVLECVQKGIYKN